MSVEQHVGVTLPVMTRRGREVIQLVSRCMRGIARENGDRHGVGSARFLNVGDKRDSCHDLVSSGVDIE
jgi:hypothetical protein